MYSDRFFSRIVSSLKIELKIERIEKGILGTGTWSTLVTKCETRVMLDLKILSISPFIVLLYASEIRMSSVTRRRKKINKVIYVKK